MSQTADEASESHGGVPRAVNHAGGMVGRTACETPGGRRAGPSAAEDVGTGPGAVPAEALEGRG